jgi:cyclohexa-1,5-dienecarbonyl-CoA hydratase
MEKINLSYLHNDSVARIILNSPKGNIIDAAMMNELHIVFADFRHRKDLKLITFEGEGDNFSFGASVEEHKKEQAGEMLRNFHSLFYELADLSIPTLAKVSGQCLGGAMELCLMCDFIFADSSAKFGQPEILLGVFAPPASALLPLKIGGSKAAEILLTGRTLTAEESQNAGFVNKIFEDKYKLQEETEEFIIKQILPKSASSLRFAYRASRVFQNHILMKFLPALEQMYTDNLMSTYDANEGINSFLERRKPVWRNE